MTVGTPIPIPIPIAILFSNEREFDSLRVGVWLELLLVETLGVEVVELLPIGLANVEV
jgi:hypothetical protein